MLSDLSTDLYLRRILWIFGRYCVVQILLHVAISVREHAQMSGTASVYTYEVSRARDSIWI